MCRNYFPLLLSIFPWEPAQGIFKSPDTGANSYSLLNDGNFFQFELYPGSDRTHHTDTLEQGPSGCPPVWLLTQSPSPKEASINIAIVFCSSFHWEQSPTYLYFFRSYCCSANIGRSVRTRDTLSHAKMSLNVLK